MFKPVLFNVTEELKKNPNQEIKHIYIEDIVFSGITTQQISDEFGIGAKYTLISSDGVPYTLKFVYSSDRSLKEILSLFSQSIVDNQLHIGDRNIYINSSSYILEADDEDYPVYLYARNDDNYVVFHLTERFSLLIKYIETKILHEVCPEGIHNLAILGIPDKLINTDILYVEDQLTIKETFYEYDRKRKIGYYSVIFNIQDVKEDFYIVIEDRGSKKNIESLKKNKYESVDNMIKSLYNEDYSNVYTLKLDNLISMNFSKELDTNPIMKSIFIYIMDELSEEPITKTFTFFSYGYNQIIKDIIKLLKI